MSKEINPVVMTGAIVATVIVVIVIAVKMFGGSSSNAAHPGDGKTLPRFFSQGGHMPSHKGIGTRPHDAANKSGVALQ